MRWELLLLAALLVVLALVGVGWSRRARLRDRVPARRAPRLRHPVILAHGMLGFDEIAVAGRRHHYFRKITDALSGVDAKFHTPRVPAAAPIAVRAEQLRALVDELPGERVNVIAHSMGGLDARYAISRLGLRDRVASLVTIGTPTRGRRSRTWERGSFRRASRARSRACSTCARCTTSPRTRSSGSTARSRMRRASPIAASSVAACSPRPTRCCGRAMPT